MMFCKLCDFLKSTRGAFVGAAIEILHCKLEGFFRRGVPWNGMLRPGCFSQKQQ